MGKQRFEWVNVLVMVRNVLLNKWSLMLVQGCLLILLSYLLFSQPEELIAGTCRLAGLIALLAGIVSITGFFVVSDQEKKLADLISGNISILAGLFFLSGISFAIQSITWFFAGYMIFNVIMLTTTSWHVKMEINWWRYTLILFLYTLMIFYFLITSSATPDNSVTVFAQVQFFINGVLIVVLALVVRRMKNRGNGMVRAEAGGE